MTDQTITIHGASWCPDAQRSRSLLEDKGVSFLWRDIDGDPSSKSFAKEANQGELRIPVIVFPDNSILIEPTNVQLEEKLAEFGL